MKIIILTLPLNENYGGILQTIALQKHLKNEGHNAKTFRYIPVIEGASRIKTYINKLRWLFYHIKNRYCPCDFIAKRLNAKAHFYRSFLTANMDETPMCYCIGQIANNRKWETDSWIVGSDQVWRFSTGNNSAFWMLDFIPEKTRRNSISYAASFGSSQLNISDEKIRLLSRYAQEFKTLSVRETQGCILCQEHFHVEAQIVPDPTLLLTAADYIKMSEATGIKWPKDYQGQYIAYYVLDMTPEKWKYLEQLSEKSGMPLVDMMYNRLLDSQQILRRPIEQWLDVIRNANYVVTDSFHGTVFSIIFNKNFSVFNNKHRGSDRFTTLLNILNTEENMVSPLEEPNFRIISAERWAQINERINTYRNTGKEFLKKNLA